MRCPSPALLACACAACLAAGGCSRNAQPAAAPRLAAPRRLELPANLRPLSPAVSTSKPATPDRRFVPAQYEQSPSAASPPAPRIREISVPADPRRSQAICEPAASASEAAAKSQPPPRRSEFVPLAAPDSSAPAPPPAPPIMPAEPTFAPPQASAAPPSPTTIAAPSEGPRLIQPGEAPAPSAAGQQQFPAAIAPPPNIGEPVGGSAATLAPAAPPAISVAPQTTNSPAMQAVAQRAMQLADRASTMAQRGMFYSAQSELIDALQLIAQSLDVQEGGSRHAAALGAGLTALSEARDFAAKSVPASGPIDVAAIAAGHRTNLLRGPHGVPSSPVVAQQQYFAFAQSQLELAAGGVPAASQILYRLGRLQTALAAHDADAGALHAPQAIVFHQTALAMDGGNWLAANELGVLYARYGQLPEARRFLVHSVSLHPHLEGWQNLAIVHRRLGETDLAERADLERQRLAAKGAASSAAGDAVRWVDRQTFAASGGPDVKWTDRASAPAVAASPTTARR